MSGWIVEPFSRCVAISLRSFAAILACDSTGSASFGGHDGQWHSRYLGGLAGQKWFAIFSRLPTVPHFTHATSRLTSWSRKTRGHWLTWFRWTIWRHTGHGTCLDFFNLNQEDRQVEQKLCSHGVCTGDELRMHWHTQHTNMVCSSVDFPMMSTRGVTGP